MSQRKNSVQLSTTVLSRLQALVAAGEFDSVDDAANFLLFQQLQAQYSAVLGSTHPHPTHPIPCSASTPQHQLPPNASPPSTAPIQPDSPPKTALTMLKHAQQIHEVP